MLPARDGGHCIFIWVSDKEFEEIQHPRAKVAAKRAAGPSQLSRDGGRLQFL